MLVSLPTSIVPSSSKDEALKAVQSTVAPEVSTVLPFKIPEFKIGTLDALVQQADDLAKLEGNCEAVVAKIGDTLRSLLEGDEEKVAQQKTVNDSKFLSHWSNEFKRHGKLTILHRAGGPVLADLHLEQSQVPGR